MSKIGNYRVGMQESADYQFGWNSAERGEPSPIWMAETHDQRERLAAQQLGWNDYIAELSQCDPDTQTPTEQTP